MLTWWHDLKANTERDAQVYETGCRFTLELPSFVYTKALRSNANQGQMFLNGPYSVVLPLDRVYFFQSALAIDHDQRMQVAVYVRSEEVDKVHMPNLVRELCRLEMSLVRLALGLGLVARFTWYLTRQNVVLQEREIA